MPVHRQELHPADLLLLLGFLEVGLQHAQGHSPEIVHWEEKESTVSSSDSASSPNQPIALTVLSEDTGD